MTVKHAFVSPKADGGDTTITRPSDWNADHVIDNDGLLLPAPTLDPGAPEAGELRVYGKSICGRAFLKSIGPSGMDVPYQASLWAQRLAIWNPPGNGTGVPGVFGMAAFTATGTVTTRTITTTQMFTRTRRLGYVSGATAGSLCGARLNSAQWTLGVPGTPAFGGFFMAVRFGCSDAATVAGARQFVGVTSGTGAFTNVEPATLTNCIGVGHGAADTNLKIFYGGSAAQTPIDLGATFPANTLSADMYELVLYAPSNANNIVNYRVTRLNTGDVAEGTLTAATPGTQLPANTTLLTLFQSFRSNNATALAVGLDISHVYFETDY